MEEKFLTIAQATEILKERGYTAEDVQKWVAVGRTPYHVRDLVIYIPWPEADAYFPHLYTDAEIKTMGAIPIIAEIPPLTAAQQVVANAKPGQTVLIPIGLSKQDPTVVIGKKVLVHLPSDVATELIKADLKVAAKAKPAPATKKTKVEKGK